MNNHKLNKLKIQNFRGFGGSKEFSIDIDRPVVLLYGDNGFGKTSFFDAIEWGLTGKLARYEGSSKERNEYTILRNQFEKDLTKPATVSLFSDQGHELTRTVHQHGKGDYNVGGLAGDLIEQLVKPAWTDIVDFPNTFSLSHILTQELVSQFIRSTKDTERYASIVSLFGLDGYIMFDPKFNEIAKAAKNEFEIISNSIHLKKAELSNQNDFLISNDIDGDALRAELANFLSVGVSSLPKLKILLSDTQQKSSDLISNIEVLKTELQGISFLEQNWGNGLANNQKITTLRTTLEKLPVLMDSCDSLSACQSIANSKTTYLEYSKDKNAVSLLENEINTFCQSPVGHLLQAPALDINSDFTSLFVLGSALSNDLQEQIENLKTLIAEQNTKKSDFQKNEQIIGAKIGLEKRLIQLAKEFFVDNTNTKHCPVCKNTVDPNSLLNELQTRIAKDSSDFFKDAIDERNNLQKALNLLTRDIHFLSTAIVEEVNSIRFQGAQKKDELQKKLDAAKKISETGKKIESWLSYLKINISQIESTILQLQQTIQTSSAFVKDQFSKDFYKGQQDTQTEGLKALQEQNSYFNQLIDKFRPSSIEKVTLKKAALNEQNENALKQKASFNRTLEIIINLQKDDRSTQARKRILEIEKEIIPLEKKASKLEQIPTHCQTLKTKARDLIKEETQKLLGAYGTTMDKIYTQLNPHSHLGKLDFRIDGNNPSNNRLIFEVMERNGNIKMNPTYTFSSAQTNVVAISIFMGIALRQQWSRLNALFLDDPIQNMDDINVHSFVDIVRSVVRDTNKQFFISTHDERVFNFMKRKFRKTAQIFHFTDYGEFVKELC